MKIKTFEFDTYCSLLLGRTLNEEVISDTTEDSDIIIAGSKNALLSSLSLFP